MRIASLIPSATEIAFGDVVAAVTLECDYPPDPRVGRAMLVGGLDTHDRTAADTDAFGDRDPEPSLAGRLR